MLGRLKRFFFNRFKPVEVKIVDNGLDNKVHIGANCRARRMTIELNGNNNVIQIGNNCSLSNTILYLFDDGNSINIGDNNSFGEHVMIVAEEATNISIGSGCQIAENVIIRTSDGHSIISNKTKERLNHAVNVKVGNRCWLGERVMLLKGAEIENDVIIGAGAIVTKGIYDSNCVYVGNPIKKVKTDVHWISPRI